MPDSFKFPQSDAATGSNLASSLMYFSFVTIATLGYGDIPEYAVAQCQVNDVVGQFYVAVIVALLVSRFIAKTRHRRLRPVNLRGVANDRQRSGQGVMP